MESKNLSKNEIIAIFQEEKIARMFLKNAVRKCPEMNYEAIKTNPFETRLHKEGRNSYFQYIALYLGERGGGMDTIRQS